MAAQHVGSVHSQSARYGEAIEFYAIAAASMERLGARDEADAAHLLSSRSNDRGR